ncbi:baseplate J/gp47 family protein [Bacillus sp. 1663tsa1]|uniref:baseplate J/gp47 family protein n=1 Tax=Bacillus sp. 1663tsa1 TaxID=2953804 RepID=UPI00209F7562|nr:baseplate J/gp47 family protein [Bacillus sp. 1663tsa1]MCP1176193.1 baseplate J/gp47 family protein [Bacillus sp. 1663tsa1]
MLTTEGFKRKRYADFIKEMEGLARNLWGNDVNLSERGPLGMFIKNISFARAEENELAESIYYSGYYFTAEGISLDYIGKNRGLERARAIAATGRVAFKVEPATTVKQGTIVATKSGVEFVTTEIGRDDDKDGLVNVNIIASVAGIDGNVQANTITEIITPIVGVNSVINTEQTKYGREEETDGEFRKRYAESFSTKSSTTNGIRARLLADVPGIRTAIVFQNTSNEKDSFGRPPYSIEAVVHGGEDEAIVKAILASKAGGVRAFGEQQFAIKDEGGNEHIVAFSRATEQPIYARVTVYRGGEFPAISMGEKLVETEVIKYIGGLDVDGINHSGLGMGDSIVTGKILANIFSNVPGVKDCTVELSKNNGAVWNTGNISIGRLQVPSTDFNKVVVNVV